MKAQLFSLDLMVALTIFLGIIMLAGYFLMITPVDVTTYNDMQMQANSIASALLSTELGTEGTLNCDRLMEMSNMSYDDLRRELGAGEYDLYIEIPNVTSTVCPGMRRQVDVMIVIDRSGSMLGQKLTDTKLAAKTFVTFLNGSYDQGGLASYSTSATRDAQLNVSTLINKTMLNTTIQNLVASGNTDIAGGLLNGTNELKSVRARPNATKVEVLLSDGQANHCYGKSTSEAVAVQCALVEANKAAAAGISVYTIGLGAGANEDLMKGIANRTGGLYYFAPSSSDLVGIYTEIALRVLSSANFGMPVSNTSANVASVVRMVQINRGDFSMIVKVYRSS